MTTPEQPTGAGDPGNGPQQPPHGQVPPAYGQQPPAYGAPQYQQPPAPGQYGQGQYNQGQYNQPTHNQGQYNQGQYGQPPSPGFVDPAQERLFAGGSHWGALLVGFFSSGTLAWLVPLAIMILKGKESAFVRAHAVESLNFQISMVIWGLVSVVATVVTLGLGFPLILAVGLWWLVFTIIGAVKASNGEQYRFPMIFRFVS